MQHQHYRTCHTSYARLRALLTYFVEAHQGLLQVPCLLALECEPQAHGSLVFMDALARFD